MNNYMQIAVKEAKSGIKNSHGGPFGAVIVKNNKIISKAHNTVLKDQDPTCHAEMNAIRSAAKKLKTFNLKDCEIYTTSEPCPMCSAAIQWARIKNVYFGCTVKDAHAIGFDDLTFSQSSNKNIGRSLDRQECLKVMDEWKKKKDKKMY